MTENKFIGTQKEYPVLPLYTMTNFLIEFITNMTKMSNYFKDILISEPIWFKSNIRCILLLSNKDENEIYTFDRTNKIRVIIPYQKYVEKIKKSNNYMKESEIHKYKIDLIEPGLDMKIGLKKNTNDLHAEFVIILKDYIKYDRQTKSFGTILQANDYKNYLYVDNNPEITENMKEFIQQINWKDIISMRLKAKNYFGFNSEIEFFENCDLLLLSDQYLQKEKSTIIYTDLNRETIFSNILHEEKKNINLLTHTNDIKQRNFDKEENMSTNGSVDSEIKDCLSMDEIRKLNRKITSLRQSYTSDDYTHPFNYIGKNSLNETHKKSKFSNIKISAQYATSNSPLDSQYSLLNEIKSNQKSNLKDDFKQTQANTYKGSMYLEESLYNKADQQIKNKDNEIKPIEIVSESSNISFNKKEGDIETEKNFLAVEDLFELYLDNKLETEKDILDNSNLFLPDDWKIFYDQNKNYFESEISYLEYEKFQNFSNSMKSNQYIKKL